MLDLILTDEQAKLVASSVEPIHLRDGQGNLLATLPPLWSEQDLAAAEDVLATTQTWATTEQVLAKLKGMRPAE